MAKNKASQFTVTGTERSGHVTVGKVTVFAAGYSVVEFAEQELNRQLKTAEAAYATGLRSALADAIALWRVHRPRHPLPRWVTGALEQQLTSRRNRSGRVGRLANEATLRRQRLIDYARVKYITVLLNEGLSLRAACKRASHELLISANDDVVPGSAKVLHQTYGRFWRRLYAAPMEFYPFMRGEAIADLLMQTPSGGEAEVIIRRHWK